MKKLILFAAIAAISTGIFAFTTQKSKVLEIGAKAPKSEMKMKDISGKSYSLQDLKEENGLLVIFSCKTCPFVVGNEGRNSEGWQGRYNELHDIAQQNKLGMVLVNSNEAYRDRDDSPESMKQQAEEQGYTMPYVVDENHVLADAFGALTTPHVFLFDKEMKLVYKGAIDDNVNDSGEVRETYLKDAMQNLAKGEKIDPESTRQLGCSIKRVKS